MADTHFTVRFENVGSRKVTWEERMPRPITDDALVEAIRRKGALMSRGIDVDETSDYGGNIYVGMFRKVGSYFILPGSIGPA